MKYKFSVEGLDCPNCAARLGRMLSAEEGIQSASVNFLTEEIIIESDLAIDVLTPAVKKVAKAFSKSLKVEKK
ncbi:MAG: heavy-metal-associated domain-containing protein [Clostridia bacterium]|nr:heavy-metal-associated domain-containing protein [Clostridia bacterium]